MAIIQEFPNENEKITKKVPEPLIITETGYRATIDNMGHIPRSQGNNFYCDRCGQSWKKKDQKEFSEQGPCCGADHWSGAIPSILKRPTLNKKSLPFMFNGRLVHKSHRITYHRGVIYCDRCGYYSSPKHSSINLPNTCLLMPISPVQEYRRNRIRMGLYPIVGGKFTRSEGDPIPYGLTKWVDNDEKFEIPYQITIKERVNMEQWLQGKKRSYEEEPPQVSIGTIITNKAKNKHKKDNTNKNKYIPKQLRRMSSELFFAVENKNINQVIDIILPNRTKTIEPKTTRIDPLIVGRVKGYDLDRTITDEVAHQL